ncbi:MAG: hypothetical protein ACYS5V_05080 [Planctomycetota bacterium]
MMFKRGDGMSAFSTRFLHQLHRDFVQDAVGGDPDRSEQLRAASLEAIQSDGNRMIIDGLAFLLVVGTPADVAVVEPFAEHQNEEVRKAAKTCCFELRHQARSASRSPRDGCDFGDERRDAPEER